MQNTYTVAELARAVDTTEAAIRGVIARGGLPTVKQWPGRVYIMHADAEVFARKRGLRLQGFEFARARTKEAATR